MKLKKELIIPYSIAIGVWNFIFTVIIATILSVVLSFPMTMKILTEFLFVGYVVLWLLNVKVIKEEGE